MQVSDFDFDLPTELIAQFPAEPRSASRLLHLDKTSGEVSHRTFCELTQLLRSGDLLVFNDTQVLPARMQAVKASGGHVELLIERILDERQALLHIYSNRPVKLNTDIYLQNGVRVSVQQRQGRLYQCYFHSERAVLDLLDECGDMPLPPYIKRSTNNQDPTRYQTIYAKEKGAIAAPTAGLHFDEALFTDLKAAGIESAFVTLHVGSATFQPVRVETIQQHQMHHEYIHVSDVVCQQIKWAKKEGRRVIAVGTTVVRSLESCVENGSIAPFSGETDIFIYPGYQYQIVDAMITNFHLPCSTLLMLVCAFAGRQVTLNAYQQAIAKGYRFYSYGDAMVLI